MARDLLIGKKTFSGVSKLSVRDADGVRRHIYQESGTPAEISTAQEMKSVVTLENTGKVYRYIGESTSEYTKGQLYSVMLATTGENVVKLTANDIEFFDGACPFAKAFKFPFAHNFTEGQAIDVVYRVDGVENTKTVYYRTVTESLDDDTEITLQTWADEQTGSIGDGIDLEEGTTKHSIYVMSYWNHSFDPTNEETGLGDGQMWIVEGMEENSYSSLEIVSIGGLKNPATVKLTEFVEADGIANPILVTTEKEMDALEVAANTGCCYRFVGSSTKRYEQDEVYTVSASNGITLMERVLTPSYSLYGHTSMDESYIKMWFLGSIAFGDFGKYCSFGATNLTLDMIDTNSTSYTVYSFGYLPNLKRLVLRQPNATNPLTLAEDALSRTGITATTGTIYVPDSLIDEYKASESWSEYVKVIRPLSEFDVDGYNYLGGEVKVTRRITDGIDVNAYEIIDKKLPIVEGLTYRAYLNVDGTEYVKEVLCVNGSVSNNIGKSEISTLGDYGENACILNVDAENEKYYIFNFINGATLSFEDGTEESAQLTVTDSSSLITFGSVGCGNISSATVHAITLASDPIMSF